jgi:hypothetical protein
MSVNAFIHTANILLLIAYSVSDVLWLRVFAVASSVIALPYFVLQPTPQRAPIAWTVVFAIINSFQAYRVFLARRPVRLTDEEEEIRRLAFPDLAPRRFLEVLGLGSLDSVPDGARMLVAGEPAQSLCLIVRGHVTVTKNSRVLGELGAGDLVGSALLMTGVTADVDAVARAPVRCLRWQPDTLERYLNAHPDTRIILQRHLARDLAGKVMRMGGASPK